MCKYNNMRENRKMDRYTFELLSYIESKKAVPYSIRNISESIKISGATTQNYLNNHIASGELLLNEKNLISITEEGKKLLEPYRVKRAVIMAAGFGSRMMPATADKPKPMVEVNGVRIIDTLLDSLVAVGITDITIIRGYKKERFDDILEKYPFIEFVDNDKFDTENNISSVIAAIDLIDNCYLCEADLYITNPEIIKKYQFTSNILGSYSLETDDWSYQLDKKGHIINYQKGNTYCYNYYGISYWTKDDSAKLRKDWTELYKTNKDIFWEEVPLILMKDNYQVEIRQCEKSDVMEIDNYYELAQIDSSYN